MPAAPKLALFQMRAGGIKTIWSLCLHVVTQRSISPRPRRHILADQVFAYSLSAFRFATEIEDTVGPKTIIYNIPRFPNISHSSHLVFRSFHIFVRIRDALYDKVACKRSVSNDWMAYISLP